LKNLFIPENYLRANLGNLLDSGDGADVTFQVQGVNIAAQKEVTK
jgi:hypothetical protein